MKAECIKEKLKEAVIQTERISGKNLSLPILESILIETGNNSLILKSTNLDIGIEVKIPAKVEKQGKTAVSGRLISNFLQILPEGENIKLELVSNNLSISTKRNSTLIKSFSADEFPIIPRIEKEEFFKIETGKFINGIKSVVYAASHSDIKPEISSVYIYIEENNLIFVSTDSYRLAEKKIDIKKEDNFSGTIIPVKNAIEIARVFENKSGLIEILFTKNQMSAVSEDIYFTSRVVGGVFPDYRQIIPKEKKTEVVVLKKDLTDAIKLATVFSDKSNQINIKILPGEKLFEISSRNQDKGESVNKIESILEGEDVDINLNAKYILDCLSNITEDSISIAFNSNTRPVVMKGVGDRSFIYLIMPMTK